MTVRFLNINSTEMRSSGRRGYPLGDEGNNISGILADLCEDETEKASLIRWLVELCAPEVEDVDFLEYTELREVIAIFVEKGGRRISIEASLMARFISSEFF